MTTIQTVCGGVPLEALGCTMMHEHIFMQYDEQWKGKIFDFVLPELWKLVHAGGRTLIDVMPKPDRRIAWYQQLAQQVDLNIILSTGFYLEKLPQYVFPEMRAWDEGRMAEMMLTELCEGIGGSGVRAGVIKVAADLPELTPFEQRALRAAARVQQQTGVPICTHACAGARNQFDLLVQSGADPQRIYLSHVEAEFGWEGRTLRQQAEYLCAIAREGGSLFFNNFAFEFDTPHEDLMYLMHFLADRGYSHRILYGMDTNFTVDEDGSLWLEAQKEHPETAVRTYVYGLRQAQMLMRRWGFGDADFHIFLVENPRRMFSTTRI
ncbi:MAG: hypothetical protein HPY45_14945 [Anaerolineae bacterium]|nr:hypothetical protein [Anaerolineae bacterium]